MGSLMSKPKREVPYENVFFQDEIDRLKAENDHLKGVIAELHTMPGANLMAQDHHREEYDKILAHAEAMAESLEHYIKFTPASLTAYRKSYPKEDK
jgi:Mg2+ and Co2+ transporter CorA